MSQHRAVDAAAIEQRGDCLASRLGDLTNSAAEYVNGELYRRYSSEKVTFKAFGRQHTLSDLWDHLGFLRGAIATNEPLLFAEYIRWRRQRTLARGLPLQPLQEALDLLVLFFQARLAPDEAGRVTAVIATGLGELESTQHDPFVDALLEDDEGALAESRSLAQALLEADEAAVHRTVAELLHRGLDYPTLATRLFQPALYHVGYLWERNRVTVAQEHQATFLAQNALSKLLQSAACAERNSRRAVFAGIEGNQHSLGLRVIADTFELAGWTVTFLGADTARTELLAEVDSTRPSIIGLSVSLTEQLPTAIGFTDALRAELGSACPSLMIGGLATNYIGGLWRSLHADAWCRNAEQAYRLAL